MERHSLGSKAVNSVWYWCAAGSPLGMPPHQRPRFEIARFQLETGPAALFERVHFKIKGSRTLKLHATHLQQRAHERRAPLEVLQQFDSERWQLRNVEVRTDTAKFVSSTWTVELEGQEWWVVIGFNDTVQTVFAGRRTELGTKTVTEGPLFERVSEVNRKLMDAENMASQ